MKKQVFIIVFALFSVIAGAQTNDPAIMKVNGKDIKKSEFEYIYKKNSNDEVLDKKTLEEYLVLFQNFKLKVTEAEAQGLDTTQAFKKELNDYRDQLAKPYLADFPTDENLIRQEYNRTGEYLEISQILVSIPLQEDSVKTVSVKNVVPADTLEAYKKAMQIRKRLLNGEDFAKVAKETSDDTRQNPGTDPGYLGWITAMMIPPAFEDAMYATREGGISMPARTSFGYHIIKVNKRIPNPGEIRAAHIMVMCPRDADTVTVNDAEKKAETIYNKVMAGEDFAELAKTESEDKGSAATGGDLSWFGMGVMVKEFQDVAFALKDTGDISRPVRSSFGFHIIKLLDKRPMPGFEEKKEEITKRLERGPLYMDFGVPTLEKLKKENGFSLDEKSYKALKEASKTLFPTDSVFISKFRDNNDVLLIAGNVPYTISDFVNFMKNSPQSPFTLSTDFLDERLYSFQLKNLIAAEDASLENKYPDFKNLMQEYRDGILLFEVSNREVWDKASKDTTGLKEFFNKNKSNYKWDKPHYKGYVIHCKDQDTKKRIQKETSKMNPDAACAYILENYRVGEVSYVKVEKGLYTEGENPYIDEMVFKKGKAQLKEDFPQYLVIGNLLTAPEEYTDVRGLVITDYQNYLEQQWIKYLNKKYPVTIYQDVVNTIQ